MSNRPEDSWSPLLIAVVSLIVIAVVSVVFGVGAVELVERFSK